MAMRAKLYADTAPPCSPDAKITAAAAAAAVYSTRLAQYIVPERGGRPHGKRSPYTKTYIIIRLGATYNLVTHTHI
jgi:hypothetical protein